MFEIPGIGLLIGVAIGIIIEIIIEYRRRNPLYFNERVTITGGFWKEMSGKIVDRHFFVWYTVSINTTDRAEALMFPKGTWKVIPRWRLRVRRTNIANKLRRRELGLD